MTTATSKEMFDRHFDQSHVDNIKGHRDWKVPNYIQGGSWQDNAEHYRCREAKRTARQEMEVYDARESLAKLAEMIEALDLSSIKAQVENIQQFAKDHDLDGMVGFCCWSDPMDILHRLVDADPHAEAMDWMRSNHDC